MDINKLFEDAMNDPSLLSTIDIDKLLESIETDKNDYLEKKSGKEIENEVYDIINELDIGREKKLDYCKKLIGYRYIDNISELHKGKHIRWIRNNNLTNGSIVVDVKFLDNGTQVLCMNALRKFHQIKYDSCILFQKMSLEEQLILMAYAYIDKK
jgi:hypothetical protein